MIIDKGSTDKIKEGDSIVYKDNLLGKVGKTSPHFSIVYLLNHKGISFTATTTKTEASGIVKGVGDAGIILDNTLLSDKLDQGDTVVTKDQPILVVGKIISVNKKASNLFQSADIKSLVDTQKLKMVFVLPREGN